MFISPYRKPGTDHYFLWRKCVGNGSTENGGLSPVSLRSEPGFRLGEQLLQRLAARGGKVRVHPGAVLRLQVGEMPVAFGKAREELRVERDLRIGIDRVDAVLLIDHRAPCDPPHALALLHPVEEAAAAHRVDFDAVEPRAQVDRHARLRERALAPA